MRIFSILFLVQLSYFHVSAQLCDCTEYIYLNEPNATGSASRVHKYAVDPTDGSLTEIFAPPGIPDSAWIPTTMEFSDAHGVGTDINGNIYIGSSFIDGEIRRVTCDGTILPTSAFAIPIQGASNIASIGNVLLVQETYVDGISVYDICSGDNLGAICFDGPQLPSNSSAFRFGDWGLYIDESENIYVATGDGDDAIYRFTLDALGGDCVTPLVEGAMGSPLFPTASFPTNSNFPVLGITADDDGNIYVNGGGDYGVNGDLYKFDAMGNFVLSVNAFNSPVGMVWVESCDCIYVSGNSLTEDCIAIYDTDLNYQGTGVGPSTGSLIVGKAIGKVTECCPTSPMITIDTVLCSAMVGDSLLLADLLDCDGVICEGDWMPSGTNTGIAFDACDNSLRIESINACGTFTLSKGDLTGSQQCGAFTITVNIEVANIEITNVQVSDCLNVNESTLTFDANYSRGCMLGDMIIVTVDGTQVMGSPFTIAGGGSGSQSISVPITANGSNGTIIAEFASGLCSSASASYTAPVSCPSDVTPCVNTSGCIGGSVFEDFNCNGTDDTEPGVQGIQIEIFDCRNNLVGTGFSDSEGDWQVCGLTDGEAYRIEHVLPDAIAFWATPTHVGTDNGSDIQFLSAPTCTQFSVSSPGSYCQPNPIISLPCYWNGSGIGLANDAFVNFSLNAPNTGDASGIPEKFVSGTGVEDPEKIADIQDIGSTWGVAYQRSQELLFASSILKRNSGFGPRGEDGIYIFDYSTSPATLIGGLDLQGIIPANGGAAIDLGTVMRTNVTGSISAGTAGDFELSDDPLQPNRDLDAFGKVGNISYGDIDITEDGTTLWLVNLNQEALISMDVSNVVPSMTIPSAPTAVVNQYPLSSIPGIPACGMDSFKAWGLKFYKGRGYLGGVCTADATQDVTNLDAYVLSFDPNNVLAGMTTELVIDMDYNHEDRQWNPWSDTWPLSIAGGAARYPQPILSDIEFADNGDMILAFADRMGFQHGHDQYVAVSGEFTRRSSIVIGDILHACRIGNSFIIEGGAGCAVGDTGPSGTSTTDGPSGMGEYYFDDYFDRVRNGMQDGNADHAEIAIGALAILPGSGEVITTVFDPIESGDLVGGGTLSQGLHWYNTTTGAESDAYLIVPRLSPSSQNVQLFGKGIGLGDLELICESAPLEIGNYVWCDSLQNGIQDACERGIDGILVQLYDAQGNLIGQDTTSNGGQYYFNQNNVDTTGITVDGSGISSPVSDWSGLNFSTQYFIVFGNGQFAMDEFIVGIDTFGITPMVNAGNNDNIDSDVDGSSLTNGLTGIVDGLPFIDMTTAATGCGDHKYDLGLSCTEIFSVGNRVWADLDGDGIEDVGESGIDNVTMTLYQVIDDGMGGLDTIIIQRDTTADGGYYLFDILLEGIYFVAVDEENFTSGQVLESQLSSSGVESPVMDTDSTDNGNDIAILGIGIVSDTFSLTLDSEPVGDFEDPVNGSGSPDDDNSNLTIDFGFYPIVSIGSTVFTDPNNDGIYDEMTEMGIGGVPVLLFTDTLGGMADGIPDGPAIEMLFTDPNGDYLFDSLFPGAYIVAITPADSLGKSSDPTITSDDNGAVDNMDHGTPNTTMDTIFSPSISLTHNGESTNEMGSGSSQDDADDNNGDMTVDFGLIPPIHDVALYKVLTSPMGAVTPGDDVTFTINIVNQGNQSLDSVVVTDYINSGYTGLGGTSMADGWSMPSGGQTMLILDNISSGMPLAEGDTLGVDITLTTLGTGMGLTVENLVNHAEITYSRDEAGLEGSNSDIDSTPDMDGTNDAGADATTFDGPADNETLGDGMGAVDDDLALTDEDDADPASVPVFDLALNKTIDVTSTPASGMFSVGDTVDFNITIVNQGNLYATDIVVRDTLPCGMMIVNAAADGWTGSGQVYDHMIDSLAVGSDTTISISVEILDPISACAAVNPANFYKNFSYIESAMDPDGMTDTDIDSDPGSSTPEELDTEPNRDGDNSLTSTGNDDPNGSQDDHDPANLEVFDLALKKRLVSTATSYTTGDTVTFEICVFNQNNIATDSVAITDYIPSGYIYIPTAANISAGWPNMEIVGQTTISTDVTSFGGMDPDLLVFGDSVCVTIDLEIQVEDDYVNVAEINSATTITDSIFSDMMGGFDTIQVVTIVNSDNDGAFDQDKDNDAGGLADSPSDDVITGDGDGEPLDMDPLGDEDDADPAQIQIQYLSLGNRVWEDSNNNGRQDAIEEGIEGVSIELYFYDPETMMVEFVRADTTDAMGYYLFDSLGAGDYVLVIPSDNLMTGGALDSLVSSTGSGPNTMTGIYEDAISAIDPDLTISADGGAIDLDDNGKLDGNSNFPGAVVSDTITLVVNTEPTLESDIGAEGIGANGVDGNSNLTVDFGFVPLLSIGSTVFEDPNNDGFYDELTETPIEGVPVLLFADSDMDGNPDGMAIEMTVTDMSGNYLFDSLAPGNYIVGILPADTLGKSSDPTIIMDDDGIIDNMDHGTPNATMDTIFSPSIELTPNGESTLENGSGSDQDDGDDNNGDMTVDFGIVPLVSVGSTVWVDLDNDGIYDEVNESPLEGITVSIYTDTLGGAPDGIPDGAAIEMTLTDAMGNYLFDSLIQGDYIIGLTPPDSLPLSSAPTVGEMDDQVDNNDNGIQADIGAEILSSTINLTQNMEPTGGETGSGSDQDIADDDNGDMTVDFGLVPLVSIGSTVFEDPNDDGFYDEVTENPISGVPVLLFEDMDMNGSPDGGVIEMVLTDMNGNYLFDSLAPGSYIVGILPADTLGKSSDPTITMDDNGLLDNMDHGTPNTTMDTIFSPSIELTHNGEATTESGSGSDQDDNDDNNGDMTVDFGLVPLVSVGSTVWVDIDNNGILDATESTLSGITVSIYTDTLGGAPDGIPDGPAIDMVITDGMGNYLFDSLLAGTYIIGLTPPDSLPLSSTPTGGEMDDQIDDNDNGIQANVGAEILSNTITLTPDGEPSGEIGIGGGQDAVDDNNGDMTVDFGLIPLMSLGSTVFYDPNNDGIQDLTNPLEGGIQEVQVDLLYDANNDGVIDGSELTPIAMTITDGEGNYLFDSLPPGNYQVVIPMPDASALTSSTPTSSMDDDTDLNDDGTQAMSGDIVLSPIVNLTAGMEPTEAMGNPGGDQDDADDSNGNMTIDFGFIPQMSIGSTVFYDPNDNGVQDTSNPLEDGIAGVTVNLYLDTDGDGMLMGSELTPVATTVTDVDGNYLFNTLPEGDYIVGVDPTAAAPVSSTGQMDGDGVDGNDNGTQPGGSGMEILSNVVNLDGNMETHTEDEQGGDQDDIDENNGDMTIDFGLVPNMSVGSTVFYDMNNDGVQDLLDPEERGIEGVQVDLYYDEDNDGMLTGDELTPVLTTTTDEDGNYFFDMLPEGNYQVGIPMPDESASMSSTGQNTMDDTDLTDDGAQTAIGDSVLSPIFTLEGGTEPMENAMNPGADQDDADDTNGNMTIDFGFVPMMTLGSTVFYDPNDNGIQDTDNPLEDGIEGVTVNLYFDADGNGVLEGDELTPQQTTTTDAEGDYLFEMLVEGDYIVGVDPTAAAPVSSTGQMDGDGIDGNDNGDQPGGTGTEILSNPVTLTGGMEPTDEGFQGGDQDSGDDANGDMTVDFGLVPNMSVGSTVFYDMNNDGVQDLLDPEERGIEGVQVDLYYDEDNDGILTGDELTPVLTTTTDEDGNYFFDMLPEGNYQVGIPMPDESAAMSSTGQNTMDDTDLTDDGAQTAIGDSVLSPIFTLEGGMEPTEAMGNPGADQDDADDTNGNMTIDFGFVPMMTLGSTVFYDPNDNGIQDTDNPLEDGIEGVTVNLYFDADGNGVLEGDELTPQQTTTTDAEGDYLFEMLVEGDYIVGVDPTAAAPVSSTGQMDGDGIDGNDNGDQPGGTGTEILSNPVTLTGGMEPTDEGFQGGDQDSGDDANGDMTVDFGLVPNMSVGSTVFYDMNNDGVQDLLDPEERGIEGVQVDLYYDEDNDGILTGDELTPVLTTTTDEDGNYFFDMLPEGNYQVGIPMPDESAAMSSTGQNTMDDTDLTDDGAQTAIGDSVLSPIFTLEGGMEPTEAMGNPGADQDDADDTNGNMTIDFGFVPMMTLGSTVFYDPNDNGIQDTDNPLEDGIEGVTVNLYFDADGNGVLTGDELTPQQTTTTDAEGDYLFEMLVEGDYIVGVDPTAAAPVSSTGQMDADGVDGNDNGDQAGGSGTEILSNPVTLTGGMEPTDEGFQGGDQDATDDTNGDMTIDFGLVPMMSVGSTVFFDMNDNGMQDLTDPEEKGIVGVQVDLYYDENNDGMLTGDELTPVLTTTTDEDGNYLFENLPEGNYQVGIPMPDESAAMSSTGQNTMDDTDLTDDGAQTAIGDSVLSPIFTLEGGMEPTEAMGNPGADQDDADDTNGNMTIDFGFVPMMTLGSTVFNDPNDNGIQDTDNPLEDGIEGVTVNLYFDADGNGVLEGAELTPQQTTTTDAEGDYLFEMLVEGDYIVGVEPTGGAPLSSTGQMDGDGVDGNDNGDQPGGTGTEILSNPVTLTGGMEPTDEGFQGGDQDSGDDANGDMTVDFGLVPNMSVGSTVFYDSNDDGMQEPMDPSESGIPGVTVQLLYDVNDDGVIDGDELIPVLTTVTDPNGDYLFDGLPEGNYQIVLTDIPEDAPNASELVDTDDNQEDGDSNGSQVDGPGSDVVSPIVNLTATEEPSGSDEDGQGGSQDEDSGAPDDNGDMTIDFGFVPLLSIGNQVWLDDNFDGLLNGEEEGIEGVIVELYEVDPITMDLVLVATEFTDENGFYLFDTLAEAEYVVFIPGSNFEGMGPLAETQSSSGTFNEGGIYEDISPFDPNTDIENDDNGIYDPNSILYTGTAVPGGVLSDVIELIRIDEPTDDASSMDMSGALDENSNQSIDFGFVPRQFDLALTKNYTFPDSIYLPGDIIDMDVVVYNQGNVIAKDIELTDYIPASLINIEAPWVVDGDMATLVVAQDSLLPGDSLIVTLRAEFAVPAGGVMQVDFINVAEISDAFDERNNSHGAGTLEDIDSTPDQQENNDGGGAVGTNADGAIDGDGSGQIGGSDPVTDEDDADPLQLAYYDLALTKVRKSPMTPVGVGEDVTFTITVFNQGLLDVTEVLISDYIPEGFVLNDPDWMSIDGSLAQIVLPSIEFMSSTDVDITLTVTPEAQADNLVNFSEISAFRDQDGNPLDMMGLNLDIDSNPDADPNNDPGGALDSPNDNFISGDGRNGGEMMIIGMPGDMTTFNDEDDHDPATVEVVDFAIVIDEVDPNRMVIAGDTVPFVVTLFNQGNTPSDSIVISNIVPDGYVFDAELNPEWMENPDGTVTYIVTDPLDADGMINIPFVLIVDNDATPDNLVVTTEIVEVYNEEGQEIGQFDIDSTPGDDSGDAEGQIFTSDDDNPLSNSNLGEEQDDADPEFTNLFDLALRKTLGVVEGMSIGSKFNFDIEVFNQGNMNAYGVEVTDYIPAGLAYVEADNAALGWTKVGDKASTVIDTVLAGESKVVTIVFQIMDAESAEDLVNVAEVSNIEMAEDKDGIIYPEGDIIDFDSEADDINDDNGNEPFSPTDDIIDESGRAGEDEDDNDQAFPILCSSMACTNSVNVSLDEECNTVLTASLLLRGFRYPDALYEIEVRDANGFSHANRFDETDAGQTFSVSVINPFCEDLSCWSNVTIENKNVPRTETSTQMAMCGATNLEFEELEDIINRINNGCNLPVSDVRETLATSGSKCDGEQVIRTIEASVSLGGRIRKVTLRIDTILYTPLDTSMIICPEGENSAMPIILECSDVTAYPDPELIADLRGITYAYPYIFKGLDSTLVVVEKDSIRETTREEKVELENGAWAIFDVITKDTISYLDSSYTSEPSYIPIQDGLTCNLSTKYVDESYPNCLGDGYKIKRTWTVLDWCGSGWKECVQWITVRDTLAPVWKQPLEDVSVEIAPWTCEATYEIPVPDIWDECSEYEVFWTVEYGIINNGVVSGLRFENSPVRVTGTAIDNCGNESYATFHIYVRDNTVPVAIVLDQINVSLTGDVISSEGLAKIYAENVDAGSHDSNCGEVELCVLLKEELANPIIRDGEHLADGDGNLIYHPSQCIVDGIYEFKYVERKEEFIEEIPYVICKEYVKFCCEDLGENQVSLIVTDQDGNTNTAWSEVLVEDKTNTGWACFSEEVPCEYVDGFEPEILPAFGGILCEVYDIREIARAEDLQCGTGYIEIIYGAYLLSTDELVSQTSCIYPIVGGSTFNPYEIKWPKHYDGSSYAGYVRECEQVLAEGLDASNPDNYYSGIVEHPASIEMGDTQECVAGMDTGEPIWCGSTCGLIGSSYEIDTVSASDACFKLIKRWTIIDWCTWEANGDGLGDDTNDTYVDEFMAIDDEWLIEADIENALTDYNITSYTVGDTNVPAAPCASCEKPTGLADAIYFRYTNVYMDGYYSYDQVIKIVDDVEPEVDVEDSEIVITEGNDVKVDEITPETFAACYTSADIEATAADMCGEIDLVDVGASWWIERSMYNGSGELMSSATRPAAGGTVYMNTGEGKAGWYAIITWRVEDGCGNVGIGESRHDFVDGKNPTPICYQDLSTAAMNTDGTVAIWAIDYDLGSFDNCSEVEVYFKDEEGNEVPSLTFGCSDLGENELRMYVSDDYGNEDFCVVTISIDDNTGICDSNVGATVIAGVLNTAYGDAIETAQVTLNNSDNLMTPLSGDYAFSVLELNEDYKIESYKNDDHLNGVSSIDLVLIQQHILGLKSLDGPYKLIAADVNADEKVSALDILELRKLILGITTEFSNNLSWRFVDAAQEFEDATSPWPFTQQLEIVNLSDSHMDENFIGVKIGDINGNVIANSALDAEGRSAKSLVLQLEDQQVNKGEQIQVPVRSVDFESIVALQMTWNLVGLEYAGIESGALEVTDLQLATLDQHTLTMAWHDTDAVTVEDEKDVLFTMFFTTVEDLTLQDAISISSKVTEAVAYNSDAEGSPLQLEYVNSENSELQFALLQNQPNPFADYTKIGFVLPEAGQATIKVFDVTSKLIVEVVDDYSAGYNEITLDRSQLRTGGVMYYQLESGDHIATRKMVLVQ